MYRHFPIAPAQPWLLQQAEIEDLPTAWAVNGCGCHPFLPVLACSVSQNRDQWRSSQLWWRERKGMMRQWSRHLSDWSFQLCTAVIFRRVQTYHCLMIFGLERKGGLIELIHGNHQLSKCWCARSSQLDLDPMRQPLHGGFEYGCHVVMVFSSIHSSSIAQLHWGLNMVNDECLIPCRNKRHPRRKAFANLW